MFKKSYTLKWTYVIIVIQIKLWEIAWNYMSLQKSI